MKQSYFSGMTQYLLAGHPDVAKVETLADAGVTGADWHPGWLKVTLTDGRALVLCVVRASADNESSDKPDTFRPEDLHGSRQVPSLQGGHVG